MIRLIRSLLFAPANRHDLLKKLPRYPADAVAIDLEDGTPENEKPAARDGLQDIVAHLRQQHLRAGLAFGAEDFITDIGGRRTPEGLEVIYARSRVILAARLAGLQALDQVFTAVRDDDAFRRDAEVGRQLGYGGKMCITPRQVEIANEVFSPSAEEVDRSRRLIQAYEAAQSEGRGTIEFEGNMVDEPLLKRARAVLQLVRD